MSNEFYLDTFGALECKIFKRLISGLDDPEVLQNNSPVAGSNEESNENKKDSDSSPNKSQKIEDPKLSTLRHREFLQNQVKFKEVVKIDNEEILESIHLVYRLTYLKDTAMARFIDDNVLANVNSIIYLKSQDIVNYIFGNRDILAELLTKMKSNEDVKAKHDAVEFFMEVCQLSRNT